MSISLIYNFSFRTFPAHLRLWRPVSCTAHQRADKTSKIAFYTNGCTRSPNPKFYLIIGGLLHRLTSGRETSLAREASPSSNCLCSVIPLNDVAPQASKIAPLQKLRPTSQWTKFFFEIAVALQLLRSMSSTGEQQTSQISTSTPRWEKLRVPADTEQSE